MGKFEYISNLGELDQQKRPPQETRRVLGLASKRVAPVVHWREEVPNP